MPARRNARNNSSSIHVHQQPTPSSSRPSPSTYPSPLPDEDEFIGGRAQDPLAEIDYPPDQLLEEGAGIDTETPLLTFEDAPTQAAEEEELPGHQRSPVLSSIRDPTPLESLSRTVRSSIHTVRSNIPISTAAPSTAVSRPVSFGSFLTNSRTAKAEHGLLDGDTIRGFRDSSSVAPPQRTFEQPVDTGLSQTRVKYLRGDVEDSHDDAILGSRWDSSLPGRRLLFIFYRAGFQIWDAMDLASVSELLNVSLEDRELDARVSFAAVLPTPKKGNDPFKAVRPLVGLVHNSLSTSCLSIYSLSTHGIVRRVHLPGREETRAGRFEVGDNHVVISTSRPPALHVLSLATFDILHTIPSAELLAFAHDTTTTSTFPSFSPTSSNTIIPGSSSSNTYNNQHNQAYNVSIDNHNNRTIRNRNFDLEQGLDFHGQDSPQQHSMYHGEGQMEVEREHPSPVFALRGRLLAYASPPPRPDEVSVLRGDDSIYTSRSGAGLGGEGVDVGSVALKVGGSVLSGFKTLGGMAYRYGAQKLAESQGQGREESVASARGAPTGQGGGVGGIATKFFSKSAPAATSERHRRSTSTGGGPGIEGRQPGTAEVNVTPSRSTPITESGHYITVVDLANLEGGAGRKPRVVSDFLASKSQPVAKLSFSADGTSLLVVPKDGQVTNVCQIRPGSSDSHQQACQVYSLRRGWSSAVVEETDWAQDGRWIAIGTRKRTIHVFAVNPYGGAPDAQSHLKGRVFGMTEMPTYPTEVGPLVRLRTSKTPAANRPKAPLSFMFLDLPSAAGQSSTLPAKLQPSSTSPHLGAGIHSFFSSSSPSNRSEVSTSPRQHKRPLNYQDILVFDPIDGQLALRRILLDVRPVGEGRNISGSLNTGISALSSALSAAGATSISLPTGRLSTSASPTTVSALHAQMQMTRVDSSNTSSSRRSSGVSGMSQGGMPDVIQVELLGKESNIATWNLQRQRDWGELKKAVSDRVAQGPMRRVDRADWLAQAEISTFSKSTRVAARSLYLSHQYSFHTLGEDYHALIRRYHFDFSGSVKIRVRKKVEVNAYPDSGVSGESFVEGYTLSRRDARLSSSSFDEPLTSALTGDLDYASPQPVLPMLPNGTPRRTFPIRQTMAGIGDGMSEHIGRFRREMHHRSSKVRSPPSSSNTFLPETATAPLEFDEEDEGFLLSHDRIDPAPAPPSPSEPIPATGILNLDEEVDMQQPSTSNAVEDDMWHRWGPDENQAVEEIERFDQISVKALMDEEQKEREEQERQAALAAAERKKRGKKGKKRS